jgi:hypothetical protein
MDYGNKFEKSIRVNAEILMSAMLDYLFQKMPTFSPFEVNDWSIQSECLSRFILPTSTGCILLHTLMSVT